MDAAPPHSPHHEERAEPTSNATSPTAGSPSFHESSFLSQASHSTADTSILEAEDSQKHPKGKRKRTSSNDKEVLDAAYIDNPKPDKQARQDIVAKVSMSEKEVQIWFQNRRQNDRRKSKPLTREDIAAFQSTHHASQGMFRATPNTPHVFNPVPNSDPATYGFMNSSPFNTTTPMRHPASAHARRPSDVISHDRMYHFGSSQETTPGSHGPSYSFESPVGYIANRRNAANNSHSFPSSQEESPLARLPHHRERRPSFRLSTDLEGRANVINEIPLDRIQVPLPPPLPQSQSHTQPSPVHDSTNSRRSFQRSQSAAASLPPVSSLLRRSLSGRSRDVSNWESCAATQQHDPLIDMAENESTGSAAAAISLIRSTSSTNGGGGVLQPSNGYKHNGRITKPQRPHVGSRKPRLSHTRSDISDILAAAVDSNEKPKEKDVSLVFGTPGTESDKENLSPDEDGNPRFSRRRRPLPAVAAAQSPKRRERSLLDSRNAPNIMRAATAPSKYGGLGSKEGTPRIYEDSGDENGKEKGKRGGDELSRMVKEANSPSKRHMLDCVSTLLSLRQGESMR